MIQSIHPIHFASHTLSIAQRKFSVFEREFLGILFALESFKHYLLGEKEFTLFTDQKSLIYAISQPMEFNNDKINRYKLKLIPYNFKIVHIDGKKNVYADFLSRIDVSTEKALFIEKKSLKSIKDLPIEGLENVFPYMAITRRRHAIDTTEIKNDFNKFFNTNLLGKTLTNVRCSNSKCDFSREQIFIFVNKNLNDCSPEWRTLITKHNFDVGSLIRINNLKDHLG